MIFTKEIYDLVSLCSLCHMELHKSHNKNTHSLEEYTALFIENKRLQKKI